ncbi:MAG TPA: PilT/PilU family type 4a pilus ATPase [Polyangiaceae bacterium LLY-WYZ-15_(1-7)]|nr:twitching motility protein PilT [Myxococcales bacterium]MAT25029.1 twitching motility protein PilT [Sandaracinus sp.]HJK93195.1 PilT/PilU family type 4a pilus ATPase [Polyangiaceae bacterium LLY-WYZ-15_(1-7)]MBJ74044.1 twitching motility protein PilT [Sandaracinus sp.]HJL03336.1 PilT/PilU family type 4a pilus ATPase [Polyangiaceae bacterium LLY-WYZ-15_(1-7)]
MDESTLLALLQKGAQHKASDVLLKVGQPPAFRVHGSLHYLQGDRLKPAQTQALAEIILRRSRYKEDIEDLQEYDTSYGASGIGRYRVNIYRQRGTIAIALRAIPLKVPSFEELRLPGAIQQLAENERGMILCVGAAGNGKSTTLAAMVNHVNTTRRVHIVTIEDPIEYIHQDQLASVSQREVGLDTPSFAKALRAALRQDPDCILVGEIRDEETMDIALKAAETGHLLLSTLHTPDVSRTIGRVLSLAGDGGQETRERFADNLKGIVAQRLLPRADGQGRVVAVEVLVVTGTARETIRSPEGGLPLKDVMERGVHPYGMQTFEMALKDLVKNGLLSVETARSAMG